MLIFQLSIKFYVKVIQDMCDRKFIVHEILNAQIWTHFGENWENIKNYNYFLIFTDNIFVIIDFSEL